MKLMFLVFFGYLRRVILGYLPDESIWGCYLLKHVNTCTW